jgi:hypothetical protein
MKNKVTKRKQSIAITELYSKALSPLAHLSEDQLRTATHELIQKKLQREKLPPLNQLIIRLGLIDSSRGFTDQEIENFYEAQALAEREIQNPTDFVTKGITSITQQLRAQAPRNRVNKDYQDIWMHVRRKLGKAQSQKSIELEAVEYFEMYESRKFSTKKIGRAISWGKEMEKLSTDT